jgi:acetyl-CoA carboxylase carboxyltransferase component
MRFSLSPDDGGDRTFQDDLEHRPTPSDRASGPVAMPALNSTVDPASEVYRQNREGMETALAVVGAELEKALEGGGQRYVARHRERGKFLARERIELLLDADTPFLELAPLAAWGTDYTVGASLVAGIGVVSGVECMVSANDPTVRGGSTNPFTMRKSGRLPPTSPWRTACRSVSLVESGGADLPTQAEIFIPGGRGFPRPHPTLGRRPPHRLVWCSATRPPAAPTSPA